MATQVSLTDGAVASAGALAIQTNGTTQAVSISTGQVATLAQNPILTSGTANGVAYLNGSKAVTSGSALTFDGTNFATTGTASATKMIPTGGSATGNGMYLPASNTLAWSNNGSETMRLDSAGNLGLGVTPSAWSVLAPALQIGGAGSFIAAQGSSVDALYIGTNAHFDGTNWKYKTTNEATYYVQNDGTHKWNIAPSGTAGNAITFTQAMTLDASGNLLVGTTTPLLNAANRGNITLNGSSSTIVSFGVGGTNSGYIYTDSPSFVLMAAGSRAMTFGTNDTERARIDSSGNLLVGTTSNNGKLSVYGGAVSSSTFMVDIRNGSYTGFRIRDDGFAFIPSTYDKTSASAANMFIDGGGVLYRSTSSLKYKKDVQDAVHGLADVLKLRAVTYKQKNNDIDGNPIDTVFGGLIAEEVHEAGLTEFVQYAEDGTPDALAYGNMVSLCIKAIQEQQALITQLTARITALESA